MHRVIFRFTVDDAGKVNTFADTLWYVGPADTLDAIVSPARDLLERRLKISGTNVRCTSIRISKDGVRRDMRVMFPLTDKATEDEIAVGFSPTEKPALPAQASDQPKACLQVRMENSSSIYRNAYIAGVPDVILRTAPAGPDVGGNPGWMTAYNAWRDKLAPPGGGGSVWGFRAREPRVGAFAFQPILLFGTAVAAPQRKYALVAAGGPALVVGDKAQVIGVTTFTGASSLLNGTFTVVAKDDTTEPGKIRYELFGTETADLSQVDKQGQIAKVGFNYYPFTRVQIVGQTTRKRGASGDRLHGRSSRRRKRV